MVDILEQQHKGIVGKVICTANGHFGLKGILRDGQTSAANKNQQQHLAGFAKEQKFCQIDEKKNEFKGKEEEEEEVDGNGNDDEGKENEEERQSESESESEESDDDGESDVENFFRKVEDQIGEEKKNERGGGEEKDGKKFQKMGCKIVNAIKATRSMKKVEPFVKPMFGGEGQENVKPIFDSEKQLDFETEHQRCLKEKTLYEDPMFPASKESIFYTPLEKLDEHRKNWALAEWKRPAEIVMGEGEGGTLSPPPPPPAQFISDGFARSDVVQGMLANCWMVSSIANLTQHPALFWRVVCPGQDFANNNYAGIFHFNLWRYGKWVDVVVDDRLPCIKDKEGKYKLIFMKSSDSGEFWSALLEKAFAKVNGTYEALEWGKGGESMEDMTGGLVESFELKIAPRTLLKKVQRGLKLGNIYGCISSPDAELFQTGIVPSHAYSLTMVREVRSSSSSSTIPLWRLRNPYGQIEWNKAWSDSSADWNKLSQKDRRALHHKIEDEGEFWIAYNDVVRHFQQIDICNIGPEVLDEVVSMADVNLPMPKRTWSTQVFHGVWRDYATECEKSEEFIFSVIKLLPKYVLTIEKPANSKRRTFPLIIALLQKHRREQKHRGLQNLFILLELYKLPYGVPKGGLKLSFYEKNMIASTESAVDREIVISTNVAPGKYLIMPYILGSSEEGEYMLRIFSTASIEANLADE